MNEMKNVFLDTETTSITPGQICQLSMIVDNNGVIESAHNYFFTVDEMNPKAQEVHGMSMDWLEIKSGGLKFSDLVHEIYPILRDNKLIAHNVKFDNKFISSELWREGISFRAKEMHCTMEIFKPILKIPNKYKKYGMYKNPNLGELLDAHDIDHNKIIEFGAELFGDGDIGFHDSRFDTTGMYVATQIYKERRAGGTEWQERFCKGGVL